MKRKTIIVATFSLAAAILLINGCVSTKVAQKSGTELWTENCTRCHSTPPSSAFTNAQWDVITTHMRMRAMLTEDEYNKILQFMQSGD